MKNNLNQSANRHNVRDIAMAKKKSKVPSYYELLSKYGEATKKTKKTKKSQRAKQPARKSKGYKKSYDEMCEKEWSNAALAPLGLGDILKLVLMNVFPKKKKAIEEAMKSDNITLKQRAKIAHILDAIDEDLMKDLGYIYDIRNKFAHSFDMKFADDTVLRLVRKLSTVKIKKIKVTKENSYELYEGCLYECMDKINNIGNKLKKRKTS